MIERSDPLVSDTPAVWLENADGASNVILVAEHAGRQFPAFVGSLGLDDEAMKSHIAWDIGAAELALKLAGLLDAPLVMQRYSRLVYDCNRAFDDDNAIVSESDNVPVPGNVGLSAGARKQRFDSIYRPFEAAIDSVIKRRQAKGLNPVVVTIHSFTPVYKGQQRELELGILHDADTRLADALLGQLESETELIYARNEPYSPADGATHTLITQGIRKGLANVMLEVRNDLIADDETREVWAERIHRLLQAALGQMARSNP